MKTTRLVVVCIVLSLLCGGIGAWVVGSVYPNILAQSKVGDKVDPKSATKIVNLIEEERATIHVVDEVTPAVVSVIARKSRADVVKLYQDQSSPSDLVFSDPSLSEVEAKQMVDVSSGTGFFVAQDGLILTNRHVIDVPGALLFVVTNEGKELPAKLIDTDAVLDIALLRVEGTGYPVATLADSEQIRIGQTVIAIGNTLSEFRNTVTKGVVSGINRRVTAGFAVSGSEVIEKAIQTDAAINPGNSGGPLINLVGEVIGVNTAVSFDGQAVAFAIPINQVKRAIEDVKSIGHIARPWLGVHYVLVTGETATPKFAFGTKLVKGDAVADAAVSKGGPADVAGLKAGDVLIAVDGTAFAQGKALAELVTPHRAGDKIKIQYIRDGNLFDTIVTLGDAEQIQK
ncbi:MAG: trypsin-like peptidase domain-containing protein [Candidatus Uhrbacteria bacterium]|nr:trypsin-like peptidase domain-containing protein [Candidatus Uhrbacteria bacterium]